MDPLSVQFSVVLAGSFGFSGTVKESTFLDVSGIMYPGTMVRHFFGHDSTQYPHWMQLILSMVNVLEALSMLMAFVGHFFPQMLHVMQFDGSNSMCPRLLSGRSLLTVGYIPVAGLENRLDSRRPPNFIMPMGSALRAAHAGIDGYHEH